LSQSARYYVVFTPFKVRVFTPTLLYQNKSIMKNITPFLWFDNEAEEAMNFYISVFPDSKVLSVTHYGAANPGQEGSVMTANFEINGQQFTALNGGPQYKFTEAVSFVVNCETQEEVDNYWEKLTADGGQPGPCGWLKDKYGLSWQIVPVELLQMIGDKDAARAQRAMQAMLKMGKLDLNVLKQAYNG
jgi:predicted 3-demethylubiquinone-9 3-methyltransferase (glyoxalase superfamily)